MCVCVVCVRVLSPSVRDSLVVLLHKPRVEPDNIFAVIYSGPCAPFTVIIC